MFRVALIQMLVGADKQRNLQHAVKLISQAKKKGAQVVALPECFNSPYGTNFFPKYAENISDGETFQMLSTVSKDNEVYLIGGSVPEEDQGKYYNTCTVWNPQGNLIGKHRKVHLFDIDIPGKIRFKESDILSPGSKFTIVDIGYCDVGIGICYDVRFEEMARVYRNKGCRMLFYPGAFNMTTGPLHWELLLRGRAVDNQVFVAGVAPAQVKDSSYISYGHSMLVDPWGKVLYTAKYDEEIIIYDIDMKIVEEVREQIPVFPQRKTTLYETIEKNC